MNAKTAKTAKTTVEAHIYPIRSKIRKDPKLACTALVYVPKEKPRRRKRTFVAPPPQFDDSVTFFSGSLPFFDEDMKFFEKNEGVHPGEFLYGMNMQTEDLSFDMEIAEFLLSEPSLELDFFEKIEEENSRKRVCYM